MDRDDRLFATIGGTIVTAAATVFLVVAGGITGTVEDRPAVRVAPIPADQEPQPPSDIVPASFDESMPPAGDDFVRAVASGISAHPEWATWLVTDSLLERFVASVEAVADGYSPSDELGIVASGRPFLVREDEGRLVIAAGTYRRYDLAVEVVESIDAEAAVAIIRELEPAIEEARRDVAWHRGSFEDRLRQAVDHLLEVEVPDGVVEVERRALTYAFADDDLEHLSGAQRQLLRLGRRNALAVQSKHREIRSIFGWPTVQPPADAQFAVDDDGNDAGRAALVIAEAVIEDPSPGAGDETGWSPMSDPVVTTSGEPAMVGNAPLLIGFEPSPGPPE
jgi:hypothetical protein